MKSDLLHFKGNITYQSMDGCVHIKKPQPCDPTLPPSTSSHLHLPPTQTNPIPSSCVIGIAPPLVGVELRFEGIKPPPFPSQRHVEKMPTDIKPKVQDAKPNLKQKSAENVCCDAHHKMHEGKCSRPSPSPLGPSILPLCVPNPGWYVVKGRRQSVFCD